MPWRPEDWEHWLPAGRPEPRPHSDPDHTRALIEILRRIPGAANKNAAELGPRPGAHGRVLAERFARTVSLPVCPPPGGCASNRERFDLIVSVQAIRRADPHELNRAFRRVWDRLSEGGLFVATFPAIARRETPFAMPLDGACDGQPRERFHELELQYRLRRAMFQGLRVKRLPGLHGDPESILTMAVRRALN